MRALLSGQAYTVGRSPARRGAIRYGRLGDAKCVLGDAVGMAEITTGWLLGNVHLFDDATPLSTG